MSDADELDTIRERKREELLERAGGGDGSAETGGSTAAPTEPIHVGGPGEFDEVTSRYGVVLVDYHAEWCGPCQMLEPIVAEVARDTPAAAAKVDIDRNPGLAGRAGIRGVPTLELYAGGERVERLVGVQDAATLRELIERHA